MEMIKIENLTKDYGEGRGNFDIFLNIQKGETFGLVGANGAGKTTLIRQIMGFLKPNSGNIKVCELDAWKESYLTKQYIGYVPGEIAFPDLKTGNEFIKSQAEFLKLKDMSYARELIHKLQLDTSANLKRMSKGMKQKTALVVALMNNPEIIILDEASTGLDPLMRVTFLDIIAKEKKKGKTIIMSSHLYEELERSCDKVALLNNGRIVNITNLDEIKNRPVSDYKIEFLKKQEYEEFKKLNYKILRDQVQYNQVTIRIEKKIISKLFQDLTQYDLKFISEIKYTLQKHFYQIIKNQKEKK